MRPIVASCLRQSSPKRTCGGWNPAKARVPSTWADGPLPPSDRRLRLEPGSVRGAALARTIRALLSADELPSPVDTRAVIPPTSEAFVRRVANHNVWIWYRATDVELVLLSATSEPPNPIDSEPVRRRLEGRPRLERSPVLMLTTLPWTPD